MAAVIDRLADLGDALHQAVIGDCDLTPDRLDEFLLAHHAAAVLGQDAQDFRCLRAKCRRHPGGRHRRPAFKIDAVIVQPKHGNRRAIHD